MRRPRPWVLGIAVILAVMAVVTAAVIVALPSIVRAVAIRQIRAQLGREATIERIRLNVFGGWFNVRNLRIADRAPGPALLEVAELDLRIRLRSLLRGEVRLEGLDLRSPTIHLQRAESGELSVGDILERFAKAPPSKEPMKIWAGRATITGGTVVFEDRLPSPAQTFEMREISVEATGVSTIAGAGNGTATLTLVLNGAPLALTADEVRLHPLHARATLTLSGLALDHAWAYLPREPAARPERGRLASRLALQYDATAGARIDGDVTVTDLALVPRDLAGLHVALAETKLNARDVVHRDGVLTAGRAELTVSPSLVDGRVTPARRIEVKDVRLLVEQLAYPGSAPGRVALTASLPAGATLDLRGTAALQPLAAHLELALAGIDLAMTESPVRPGSLVPLLAGLYAPARMPVTVERGRLDVAIAADVAAGPRVRAGGDLTFTGLELRPPDDAGPFVTHKKLRVSLTDLSWHDGALALARLALEGAPTIVDAHVSPPARFDFSRLTLVAEDLTWPVQRPIRARGSGAVAGSGTSTLEGTIDPRTLAAQARVTLADVDLARVAPYVPPASPVTVRGGRFGGTVRLTHDRATGVRLSGDGAVADLALARPGAAEALVSDRRLSFALDDVVVKDTSVALRRLTLTGAPSLADDSVSPVRRVDLRALRLAVEDVAWPGRRPLRLDLGADLPVAGTLTVRGQAALDARRAELDVRLEDVALAPYRAWLPIETALAGTAEMALTVAATAASGLEVTVKGTGGLRNVRLGPPERPPLAIERVETSGIDVQWPSRVRVDRLTVTRPSVLVERDRDGTFPVRAMLTPRSRGPETGAGATPATAAPPARAAAPEAPSSERLAIEVGEVAVEDGDVRFIDRATTPFYSEEITRLAVRIGGLSTTGDARARVAMQGIIGATGAIDLTGEVAPFADTFFLDIAGELRDFPLPRTNPQFRRFFDWLLQRGSLTTRVHYRIVGDRLEADNQVHVQRLSVERARSGTDPDKKIGLPLGLIVAMVTDSRGDIKFSLPVSGRLTEPGFSFGDAILSALKNVLTNLVTGPFRAIGKIFSKGGTVEELKVDPLTYESGSANLTPEADKHLQQVADFLRASPNITLTLRPVVTAGDLASLATREVTARIQRLQREEKLPDFAAAATRAFVQAHPDRPVPKNVEDIVAALRESEPVPPGAVEQLAARRLDVTREALIARAGVEPGRVHAATAPARVDAEGEGRVEFELTP